MGVDLLDLPDADPSDLRAVAQRQEPLHSLEDDHRPEGDAVESK